jgi:hypothetical protein
MTTIKKMVTMKKTIMTPLTTTIQKQRLTISLELVPAVGERPGNTFELYHEREDLAVASL